MGSPGEIVLGGDLWLAVVIALAAGLVSFLSPCVLPLVPGYLGYVSGAVGGGPAVGGEAAGGGAAVGGGGIVVATRRRSRVVLGSVLFIAGFTAVFLTLFVIAGVAGSFLLRWQDLLLQIGGVVVILMGLVFIGQVTVLQRTVRSSWQPRAGLVGAPLLGVVFAVGWTPCISPTLTAVSVLSGFGGDPGRALVIGLAYCLGLGIPFVLVALGFGWVGGSVRWVRRHIRAVNIAGGVLLIVTGVLMVTGAWSEVMGLLGGVVADVRIPL